MTPVRDLETYRERDKPEVVVDGKTTFSSSVSIAFIVSKLMWKTPQYGASPKSQDSGYGSEGGCTR